MRSWKFEPIRWMTTILVILMALEGVQEFVDLLPEQANAWILFAIAILTAILGVNVRNKVTPLADPKTNEGHPLVPARPGSRVQPPPGRLDVP